MHLCPKQVHVSACLLYLERLETKSDDFQWFSKWYPVFLSNHFQSQQVYNV